MYRGTYLSECNNARLGQRLRIRRFVVWWLFIEWQYFLLELLHIAREWDCGRTRRGLELCGVDHLRLVDSKLECVGWLRCFWQE